MNTPRAHISLLFLLIAVPIAASVLGLYWEFSPVRLFGLFVALPVWATMALIIYCVVDWFNHGPR